MQNSNVNLCVNCVEDTDAAAAVTEEAEEDVVQYVVVHAGVSNSSGVGFISL